MNILVLDSDLQSALTLKEVLRSGGHKVHVTSDGAEALLEAGHWAPHLVLVDLKLPINDGLGFCRSLRKTSEVPILVLSAQREPAVLVEALDAGADAYITKPLSVSELQARVRGLVRRYGPTANEESVRVLRQPSLK